MKHTKKGIVRKTSAGLMLLLKPKNLCNSDKIAKNIALRRWAKEVQITTGRYGFVISTRNSADYNSIKRDLNILARGAKVYELAMHSTYKQV